MGRLPCSCMINAFLLTMEELAMLRRSSLFQLIIPIVSVIAAVPAVSQSLPMPVCEVKIYDENAELEDSRIAVDLAKSKYDAYQKIFKMIV